VQAHLSEPSSLETHSVTTGIITSADAPPAPVEPMNIEVSSEFLAAEPTFTTSAPALDQTGALHGEVSSLEQPAVHHSLVGAQGSAQALPGAESLADESASADALVAPVTLVQPASELPPTA
jgi:hypothetical protein